MSDFRDAKIRFLRTLMELPDGARRKDIPPADRKNDLVRQACRRAGWAVYLNKGKGARWHITPRGEEALSDLEFKA